MAAQNAESMKYCLTVAAAPAAAGVAIEVPAMDTMSQVSVVDPEALAEYVKYPGATTSGYKKRKKADQLP
jgi:hypothetical protein